MKDKSERRWAVTFVYVVTGLLLLAVFLWWLFMAYVRAFEQTEPWSGEFTCKPGDAYTVVECP